MLNPFGYYNLKSTCPSFLKSQCLLLCHQQVTKYVAHLWKGRFHLLKKWQFARAEFSFLRSLMFHLQEVLHISLMLTLPTRSRCINVWLLKYVIEYSYFSWKFFAFTTRWSLEKDWDYSITKYLILTRSCMTSDLCNFFPCLLVIIVVAVFKKSVLVLILIF